MSRAAKGKIPQHLFRRHLDRTRTKAERLLWPLVRSRRLGYEILKQVPIGPYFLDFYAPRCRVAIEIDGSAHDTRQAYDARRDFALLADHGIRTLRFTNAEVFANPSRVAALIGSELRGVPRKLTHATFEAKAAALLRVAQAGGASRT